MIRQFLFVPLQIKHSFTSEMYLILRNMIQTYDIRLIIFEDEAKSLIREEILYFS